MVKFTRKGEWVVNCFIQDCIAKRKKILDAEKDEAGDVLLPSKEDILCDIEFQGYDADGEYINVWGITEHYSESILLTYQEDFVIE